MELTAPSSVTWRPVADEQLVDATGAPILLSGGRAESLLTPAATGSLRYANLAVTRWTGDPTRDADGIFVYVRDLDDGQCWSAGLQPSGEPSQEYIAQFAPGKASYRRLDSGVRTTMEVCIDPQSDVEFRRITLGNESDRPRRLATTSYLEWVLQNADADSAHPAFSKLFVETTIHVEKRLIVARRRARDDAEPVLAGGHWVAFSSLTTCPLEFETSRAAFLGRGRSVRNPAALDSDRPLSGESGPVLDPVASVRNTFFLEPGESAVIVLATAARHALADLVDVVRSFTEGEVQLVFERAQAHALSARPPNDQTQPTTHGQTPATNKLEAAGFRFDPPHALTRNEPDGFRPHREPPPGAEAAAPAPLSFDNGLGGFSAAGDEYIIRLRPDTLGRLQLPPLPWSHVVANPQAGFIATETGAGYTWTVNSRENRLTHWSNDPVCDPHSEAIYLRDRDRKVFWSPTPGPAGPGVLHEVRYGFGYAQYRSSSVELLQETTAFVPQDESLKITRLSFENLAPHRRALDIFSYAQLALGNGSRRQSDGIHTWFDEESQSLFAANPARELADRVTFVALIVPRGCGQISYTGDRQEFLGHWGELASPLAVRKMQKLSGRCGSRLDPCAALQTAIEVAPGQAAQCFVLVGEAPGEDEARASIARYSDAASIDAALADVRGFWADALSAIQIDTPSESLNFMVNGWLPYQNLSCRMWGRSAYYQSGGAFGFRDQLQDSAALVYHLPELTRRQLLRHASSQFVEGDVLHWWHPPAGQGIRTRFADDLLWLPLIAAEYCQTTGDDDFWNASAPYLTAPPLPEGEAEQFLKPMPSRETGSVFDHACRAIDRSLTVGAHGLPLFGCGDWNDGMNRVGRLGRGESVWMGFFLYHVLDRMVPVCMARGEGQRADRYREHQIRLRAALNGPGWDGHWYRRAFFDDGTPLGAESADECQIDALVQAWAVLSGAGDAEFSRKAMAAVERRLVCEEAGLIRLLDPPFNRMAHDPGYIKGYLPGIRENGGQYTHGVLWFIRALAEMGRGTRAVDLLDMLNPINHARTANEVAIYQAEPYVVAADVYSQPPHVGRAGWTWYTGSAGWMFRVAVESVLGLQVRGGRELVLNPCVSADWPRCRLQWRLPAGGGSYAITIENPDGQERGVKTAVLDGMPAPVENGVAYVPLVADGRQHNVSLRI